MLLVLDLFFLTFYSKKDSLAFYYMRNWRDTLSVHASGFGLRKTHMKT